LGGRKGIRPVKTEWWGAGVVICLERGADLHMSQLMPLPLTVSCSSKIEIGFTFLVPAYPGCPGKEAVKWLLLLSLEEDSTMAGGNVYRTFGNVWSFCGHMAVDIALKTSLF